MSHSDKQKTTGKAVLYSIILVAITAVAFLPSLNSGFTNWDDDAYVTENPDIKSNDIRQITKVVSSRYVGNYHPLTMLTYMAEYGFFKLNPFPYHFTNLLLHCLNGLLVFALIYGLSGSLFTSLLAGLLFAVHPLRVESVAWIAERKDVLSSFFFFFSLLLYLRYLKNSRRKFYAFSLLALLFSLLSKPIAVSLPFVLLLIDYLKNIKIDKKVLLEKLPFFALAAVFAAVTLFTQKSTGPVSEYHALSTLQRLCVPFYGVTFYLVKSLVPMRLCSYYSFPVGTDTGMNMMLFSAPFLVIGAAAAMYRFRRYSRTLVFGTLFFLITALPILQIVPIGGAIVAERYTYVPIIGIAFLFAGWFVSLLRGKSGAIKIPALTGVVVAVIALACLTHERCKVWNSSLSLWSDVIAKFPGAIAYTNRGAAYNALGNYDRAIEDYTEAIRLNPGYALAYSNRGVAYKAKGDLDHAIEDYDRAITLNPEYAQAYNNRGVARNARGDNDRAVLDFTRAIKLNPNYAQAYNNRAVAFCCKGEYGLAVPDFTQAIKLNPRYIEVYYNRGLAYKALGDNSSALEDIKKACAEGITAACKLLSGN